MMKALGIFLGVVMFGVSLASVCSQAYALTLPQAYLADTPQQQICAGVGLTTSSNSCGDQGAQINDVLKVVVNLLSLFVGILTVIMVVIAGFRFVTSGGDSGKVASAKNTLIYALIGLVIVALSQAIVQFVLKALT